MKQILINDSHRVFHAYVDDEDFDDLIKYNWYYEYGFAIRHLDPLGASSMKGKMSNDIMGEGEWGHKNKDHLDNRKENLVLIKHNWTELREWGEWVDYIFKPLDILIAWMDNRGRKNIREEIWSHENILKTSTYDAYKRGYKEGYKKGYDNKTSEKKGN